MAESGCTRLTAVVCTAYPRSRISVAACSSQNRMSISRYIVVAVVRCSLRLLALARAPVELAEAEVAVGDERAHAELAGESQRLAVVAFERPRRRLPTRRHRRGRGRGPRFPGPPAGGLAPGPLGRGWRPRRSARPRGRSSPRTEECRRPAVKSGACGTPRRRPRPAGAPRQHGRRGRRRRRGSRRRAVSRRRTATFGRGRGPARGRGWRVGDPRDGGGRGRDRTTPSTA